MATATKTRKPRTIGSGLSSVSENEVVPPVSTSNGPSERVAPGAVNDNFSDDLLEQAKPEQAVQIPAAPAPAAKPVAKVNDEELINLTRGVNTTGDVRDSVDASAVLILRKIPKQPFRLGLERQEELMQLMPGTVHKFEPYRQGNSFLTKIMDFPEEKTRLEKILNVDLSPTSEFYYEITFPMTDRPHGQFLTLDNSPQGAYEAVVYYCMIASPLVANGIHEYTDGTKPLAEWYIENKEAEALTKSAKVDTELLMFEKLAVMPDNRRVEIAKIMMIPDAHTGSPTLVKTALYTTLKSGSKQITAENACRRFMEIVSWSDLKISTAALVEDAIEMNLLRQTRTKDYAYGDEILGLTKEEVMSNLSNPRYSQIKASLVDRVNHKKK